MGLPVVLDLETDKISARPEYPPRPVGLAVKFPGKASYYLDWGHPDSTSPENFGKAKELLTKLYNGRDQLCFWNAKFDLEVIEKFFELPLPHWSRVEDGLFSSYLFDPHAPSLALKPTAERLLGEAPTEQDEVREWLISQKIVRRNQKDWGAYISKAPSTLVTKYARADVDKTFALFKLLAPKVKALKMVEAYNRERELLPILLRNEQSGVRCDVERLSADIERYQDALAKVEKWIRKHLKSTGLNLDADREVAAALEGHVKEWSLTATGQKSVSKVNLRPEHFVDSRLASAMGYRTRVTTCLSTFMRPWYELAQNNGGRVCTSWNQTRGDKGGTRTGRLSSSRPLNLQNIPKSFDDKPDGYAHPTFLKVPPLPLIRQYILPDEGHTILHRDFASQELRVLAHYEDGSLLNAYRENVNLDVHQFARDEIQRIAGLKLERRAVKIAVFTGLYSGGIGKLAEQLGSTVTHAQAVRDALRAVMPGVASLERELKATWRKGEPIRTWGGRLYHCEPPSNGRTYDYRALNVLIQSSAADITKQALINYDRARQHGRLQTCVHDELNLSVPIEHAKEEMEVLRQSMESIPLDVALISEGKHGPSWGELKKYEEPAN